MPVRTPFEPEQAVADERSIGTQEIGDEGGDGQPEQRRHAGFIEFRKMPTRNSRPVMGLF